MGYLHAIQLLDVFNFKFVKNLSSFFSRADNAHLTQSAQLMRYGGFGHFEFFGKHADAHLAFAYYGDDSDAACIAESAEEFGKLDGFEFCEFHIV